MFLKIQNKQAKVKIIKFILKTYDAIRVTIFKKNTYQQIKNINNIGKPYFSKKWKESGVKTQKHTLFTLTWNFYKNLIYSRIV